MKLDPSPPDEVRCVGVASGGNERRGGVASCSDVPERSPMPAPVSRSSGNRLALTKLEDAKNMQMD